MVDNILFSESDIESNFQEKNEQECRTVIELFEKQVKETPRNIAVCYEGESLTYEELNRKANQLARTMRSRGVRSKETIGIISERSLELMIGILAILKVGAAYLPVDPNLPSERIDYILKDSKTKVLLTYKRYEEKIDFMFQSIFMDCAESYDEVNENLGVVYPSRNLIYVIYTSGTTGNPKGAMVRNDSFMNLIQWYTTELSVNDEDSILIFTSISFDQAQKNLFGALVKGGKLVFATSMPYDYELITGTIQKEKITITNCTPSAFYPILYFNESTKFNKLSSLRLVVLGGESINLENMENWLQAEDCHAEVVNTYGPTECTDTVTFHRIDKKNLRLKNEGANLGRLVWNVEAYIFNSDFSLTEQGDIGELYLGGLCVGDGYVNEKLNEKAFILNPISKDSKIYKTGDLVRRKSNGDIQYIGRVDNQVKIRGHRIELEEIEASILRHDEILEAAVIPIRLNGDIASLSSFYVSSCRSKDVQIKAYLSEILPEYAIPSTFIKIDSLPLTPNGKINRKMLEQTLIENRKMIYEKVREKSSVHSKINEIWEALLGNSVDYDDNFFECGGHSLLTALMVRKISEEFSVTITPKEVYIDPTINGLALMIEKRKKNLQIGTTKNDEHCAGKKVRLDDFNNIEFQVQEIVERYEKKILESAIEKKYDFGYVRKIKAGYVQNNKDNYHFVHSVDVESESERKVLRTVAQLISEQSLLRTSIRENEKGYVFAEHTYPEGFENSIIDISEYNSDSKEKIIKHINETATHMLHQDMSEWKLHYKFLVIKQKSTSYKILLIINHLISDSESTRILKHYFSDVDSNGDKKLKLYDSFNQYLTNVFNKDKAKKLSKLENTMMYKMYNQGVKEFYKQNKKFLNVGSIVFSKPLIIKFTPHMNGTGISSLPIANFFEISINLIHRIFELKNVPTRIFVNNRFFDNENFYNTIGDFSDSVLTNFQSNDISIENVYKEYLKAEKFFSDNSISLKSLRTIDSIKELFIKSPFTLNYLGDITDEESKDLLEQIDNFHTIPYPIQGFSVDGSLYIIVSNGVSSEHLEKINPYLNQLSGELHIL